MLKTRKKAKYKASSKRKNKASSKRKNKASSNRKNKASSNRKNKASSKRKNIASSKRKKTFFQKGGLYNFGGILNSQLCDDPDRFTNTIIDTVRYDKPVKLLQIIDTTYAQRYILEQMPNFNICLYDKLDKCVYIYSMEGNELTNDIKAKILINLIDSAKNSKENKYTFIHNLKSKKLQFIELESSNGCFNVNLNRVRTKLIELNERLQKKCAQLFLQMDDYYNLPGNLDGSTFNTGNLTLCLYYDTKCISSIDIKYVGDNKVEISSKTLSEYEGKKYNKFLRATIIIISTFIMCETMNITTLISRAINPISARLLISNFDTTYSNSNIMDTDTITLEEFEKKHRDSEPNVTQADLIIKAFEAFKVNNQRLILTIEIVLNSENINKANKLFDELTSINRDGIFCPSKVSSDISINADISPSAVRIPTSSKFGSSLWNYLTSFD